MILLSSFTASAAPGQLPASRGNIQSVHYEVGPGQFIHIALNAAGLVIRHGDTAVGLPLPELVKLAQEHEPAFLPAPAAPAPLTP